jgi:hypothetical protein
MTRKRLREASLGLIRPAAIMLDNLIADPCHPSLLLTRISPTPRPHTKSGVGGHVEIDLVRAQKNVRET